METHCKSYAALSFPTRLVPESTSRFIARYERILLDTLSSKDESIVKP